MGALLFLADGTVLISGGSWPTPPTHIMQGEARAAALALRDFHPRLPQCLHILIDSTSVLGVMRRRLTKSNMLAAEIAPIRAAIDASNMDVSFGYVKLERNPADGLSRGLEARSQDLRWGADGDGETGTPGGGRKEESPYPAHRESET